MLRENKVHYLKKYICCKTNTYTFKWLNNQPIAIGKLSPAGMQFMPI